MSLDPSFVATTPEAKIADKLSDFARRLDALERGSATHAPQRAYAEYLPEVVDPIGYNSAKAPNCTVNITTDATLVAVAFAAEAFQTSAVASPLAILVNTAAPGAGIFTMLDLSAWGTAGAYSTPFWASPGIGFGNGFGSLIGFGNATILGTGTKTFSVNFQNGTGGGPVKWRNQRLWIVTI